MEEKPDYPSAVKVKRGDEIKLDPRFTWAEVTTMDDFPYQSFVPTGRTPEATP